jgi:hypothetical protein
MPSSSETSRLLIGGAELFWAEILLANKKTAQIKTENLEKNLLLILNLSARKLL